MSAPSLRFQPGGDGAAETGAVGSWRTSRWIFAVQILFLLAITATVVTRYWSDHVWVGWALVAVATAAWAPQLAVESTRRWWFVYVVGIFVYTILRSYADETAIPTRFEYVIEFDRVLPGPQPGAWLQGRYFTPEQVGWLDLLMVGVHWSFFIAPHLAAVLVFLFAPRLFPRFVVLMVGTMWLGLLLFFLLPTAPPWFAAQAGYLPEVYRVMDVVGGEVSGESYKEFYASLGEPNSVAAMPSIHMAITFALFLWARDHHPRWQWPLLGYSIIMGIALVYLGEHYVADEVVGVGLALLAHTLVRRTVDRGLG
ncbi:MAG: phosphatase PAP2 family protein [Dehalococcoidia bacterium]|nr:phosphatase PAP2 family protein [Dehalococcoidia bacterium]